MGQISKFLRRTFLENQCRCSRYTSLLEDRDKTVIE